ncbi:MAG: regulatory protein RecX [Anaerotardibacter sp.]
MQAQINSIQNGVSEESVCEKRTRKKSSRKSRLDKDGAYKHGTQTSNTFKEHSHKHNTVPSECSISVSNSLKPSSIKNLAELSEEDENELIDSPEKAFRKIQQLISVRDRSVHEIEQRLITLNYSPESIQIAIERALECNYLNDKRFAEIYLRSKVNRNKGLQGAKRDLLGHNISESCIDECIEIYFNEDDEEERAYLLLCQKPPRAKNAFQAAYGKLIRNGYQSNVALAATKRWISTLQARD